MTMPSGKVIMLKLFPAPVQDKQINHARLNIISTTLHAALEFVFLQHWHFPHQQTQEDAVSCLSPEDKKKNQMHF